MPGKGHLFWEGYKILQNLHRRFDWHYLGQIYGGDFTKFSGLSEYMNFIEKYFSLKLLLRPMLNILLSFSIVRKW